MRIVAVCLARFPERRDRSLALAKGMANFAERKPGRRKAGRQLGRLLQNVGSPRQVPLELQVAREFIAPIGH